jgi:hypothetical protein
MDLLMIEYTDDPERRKKTEAAVADRLARWQGEDAIELLRELNSIAVRTYQRLN